MRSNATPEYETDECVAACRRELPDRFGPHTATLGFDGIIDTVREMVAERAGPDEYVPFDRLDRLAERIADSASVDTSLAVEWIAHRTRTGGLVCHLGRAMGNLSVDPIMVGTFGDPIASEFESEFGEYRKTSIGTPGYTDAVEFNDGKLLLTEPGTYRGLDWERVCDRVGRDRLAGFLEESDLLAVGYWAMIPGLPSILEGLAREVWPTLSSPPADVVVDPADIRQLTSDQVRAGVDPLRELDDCVPVTFSANRAESAVITEALDEGDGETIPALAAALRRGLGISRVVTHGVDHSAMATADGVAAAETIRVDEPELTTSAGDHFNVGLCMGLMEEMTDPATTALGNVVAGSFVRSGRSPSHADISAFVDEYAAAIR
jgi:hypothetical protein